MFDVHPNWIFGRAFPKPEQVFESGIGAFFSFIYSVMDVQGQPEVLSKGRAVLFDVKRIRGCKFKLKCSRGSQISTLLISSLHKILGKIPGLTRLSGLCKASPR